MNLNMNNMINNMNNINNFIIPNQAINQNNKEIL